MDFEIFCCIKVNSLFSYLKLTKCKFCYSSKHIYNKNNSLLSDLLTARVCNGFFLLCKLFFITVTAGEGSKHNGSAVPNMYSDSNCWLHAYYCY